MRGSCQCENPACLNCQGTHKQLGQEAPLAREDKRCRNCFDNKRPDARKKESLPTSGAGKRKRAQSCELAKSAVASGQRSLLSLRGGSEVPGLWHLSAEDAARVHLCLQLRVDARVTSGHCMAALGSQAVCCLRTYGSDSEPVCGFNAIFGHPADSMCLNFPNKTFV